MPLLIWGTRGVTSTAARGDFHCPGCGASGYAHSRRLVAALDFDGQAVMDAIGAGGEA